MKICLIEWGDAWIDMIDITTAEAKKLKPVARQTVGYYVEETKEKGVLLWSAIFKAQMKKDKMYAK